jgi:two-component system chemotaxis response regulator CheY
MILIVDDEPSALVLLGMVLQSDNFVVRKATSGKGALWLLDRDEGERCNLVITDVRMPDMDGKELVAQMRANPRLSSIPVIMCTSATDRETVTEMIGQGVRGYVVKPFKAATVLAKVREVLDDEHRVIEPRAQTEKRLRIDPQEYAPLASATVPTVENIADELIKALRVRNSRAVRAAAERVWEPASLFGGSRAVAAAQSVLDAPDETTALRCAGLLVTELGELLSALQRVVTAQRL